MGNLAAAGDGDLVKWLAPMVTANFECDDPCNNSPHRYYCTTCYSVFFGKKSSSNSSGDSTVICPNSSPNHQLHKILQVYKASHAFSVRIEDMEPLWNPSNICVYIINNHNIYFIQQKQKSSTKFLVGNNHRIRRGYCRICEYKLKQPHDSFCSIECKLTELKTLSTADDDIERVNYVASSVMSFLAATAATAIQLSQSLRKRPRKSLHPQRAPLF